MILFSLHDVERDRVGVNRRRTSPTWEYF